MNDEETFEDVSEDEIEITDQEDEDEDTSIHERSALRDAARAERFGEAPTFLESCFDDTPSMAEGRKPLRF
jgi:hypothetical protein